MTLPRSALLLATVAAATLAINGAGNAKAKYSTFIAVLNAGQLAPLPPSNSLGVAFGTLEPDGMFCFSMSYTLEGEESDAHIHGPGKPGANAGVHWVLDVGTPKKACVGPLTKKEKKQLRAGLYYFVIHSSEIPRGEMRGQIVPVPAP